MDEKYEETNVLLAKSSGREEKESGSGEDDGVKAATREKVIQWRFWQVPKRGIDS